MSDVMTRADSIREYLTGATSDGGAQTNPALSLGHYRSLTEAQSLGITIATPIANITVNFACGANALGAGVLTCVDANTLNWAQNGDTAGPNVTISNGQSKVLESGTNPGAFLRVTRTSATGLVPGTSTITLTEMENNQFGMYDVSNTESAAGGNDYAASIVKNVSASDVTAFTRWLSQLGTTQISNGGHLGASGAGTITTTGTFVDWPASGWCRIETSGNTLREVVYYTSRSNTVLTVPSAGRARFGSSAGAGASTDNLYAIPGCAIGIDTAGVTAPGSIQTIADSNTAPTSVTFITGIRAADGLNVGTITMGQQVGLWQWREVPVGASAITNQEVVFVSSFNAA